MAAHVTPAASDSNEHTILAAFDRERLRPSRWSNGAHDTYASHSHGYHKVLYCLRGSITFRLVETEEDIELHAGDRLDIEPGTVHAAVVGPQGVECVEAARG